MTDAKTVLLSKENVRVLECGDLKKALPAFDYKKISGGLLIQDKDLITLHSDDMKCVSSSQPSELTDEGLIVCLESCKVCQVKCYCLCQKSDDNWSWCWSNV